MARPTKGYYNAAGKRIVGTTTVLHAWKPSVEGLLVWANRLGQEGIDHKDARGDAANSGTLVHQMVEAHIDGKEIQTLKWALAHKFTEDHYKAALIGFDAAKKWLRQTKIRFTEQEIAYISEKYQYGGTPDAVGVLPGAADDEYIMLDWKTGKLYESHLLQVSAYKNLWEENHPNGTITEVHLCRFGKEFGDFGHSAFPLKIIDLAWEGFKHLLAMYQINKELKKAV